MRIEEELKTTRFRDEIHKAQLNILFTATWLRTRISATLKPYKLTMEQFNVMRILRGHQHQDVLIKDITNRMLERNSNTTRIVDRLEAKGLVKRRVSPSDRRERFVTLTPAGFKCLSAIDRSWDDNNPHTAPWTLEEARQVNELLDKMRE